MADPFPPAGSPMSNAADPVVIERQQQRAAFNAAEARLDLRHVLSTPRGRRFVWRVLAMARIYEQSFTGDALTTAFNEGRRAVGNQLLAELNDTDPDAFVAMLREQRAAASAEQALEDEARENAPNG